MNNIKDNDLEKVSGGTGSEGIMRKLSGETLPEMSAEEAQRIFDACDPNPCGIKLWAFSNCKRCGASINHVASYCGNCYAEACAKLGKSHSKN